PMCGRPQYGETDKLYQNNGDGTFTDVTKLLGSKITGSGFVASFTDYDNDGDLDIYLVNDEFINPIRNVLWRNDGPGCDGWCFTEIAEETNADIRMMGMGLATADYDNDGDQDFYISNVSHMVLLENLGDGSFADAAELAGVDSVGNVGWGNLFFDYDNDGWQDIYLAVSDAMGAGSEPRSPLYRNQQDGTFADMSNTSGVSEPGRTLGVAAADYNRDGRVDLLIGDFMVGYQLFENRSSDNNNWLAIELIGSADVNRDAVGSRVTVTTADGLTQMREIISGSGLGAGNELMLNFGLGQNEFIEKITVRWPNGQTQTFVGVAINQILPIEYSANLESVPDITIDETVEIEELIYSEPLLDQSRSGNFEMVLAVFGVLAMMFLAFGGLYQPE
ncbi:MAG: CRTAC1 family protein, partial [Chloroflexota bacterium]